MGKHRQVTIPSSVIMNFLVRFTAVSLLALIAPWLNAADGCPAESELTRYGEYPACEELLDADYFGKQGMCDVYSQSHDCYTKLIADCTASELKTPQHRFILDKIGAFKDIIVNYHC